MTVFERIKDLAKKRDKSLQRVAEELNFSKNIFYKWKQSDPKGKDLEKVADYFHVTVDYLLGRTDDPLGSGEKSADLDDDTVLFTYQGKQLSDEDRKKMLEIFKLMNKNNDN